LAFALVEVKGLIQQTFCENEYIGIMIDLSDEIEKSISAFDALIDNKIKSITFLDSCTRQQLIISIGEKGYRVCQNKTELALPVNELEIIRGLMLDVFVHNAFDGYHYDFDLVSKEIVVDICIFLQKTR